MKRPDWWTPAHEEAVIFLLVTLGALVDRRMRQAHRCWPCRLRRRVRSRRPLTIRDTDVLTVELHWPGKTGSDEGPRLQANGNAETERAEPYGDPDTRVMFGFGRPES